MSRELIAVLCIFAAAVLLFMSNRVRSDIVAVITLLALMLTGVLTVQESLAGFSNPVVLVTGAMFILGEAMVHTGIAQRTGEAVLKLGHGSEARLIALLMIAAGSVGAFMSSTAVVALFIPVALSVAARANLNPKRMLMPLAAAGLVSGMMTLIATPPNLILDTALKARGLASLGFFGFTPFGVAILAVTIIYMLCLGRGMLSCQACAVGGPKGATMADLIRGYGLQERVHRLLVPASSPLVDRAVARMQLRDTYGVNLIGFEKHHAHRRILLPPSPDTVFEADDEIFVVADEKDLIRFIEALGLLRLTQPGELEPQEAAQQIGLAEIMLTPESKLIGQTLLDLQFHAHYNLTVLAVRRRGKPRIADLAHLRLDFGDALLVSGSWPDVLRLRKERENIVVLTLPEEFHSVAPAPQRGPYTLVILAGMVAAMASGLVPNVAAALLAALALVAARCVKLDAVYRVIGWQTLVLVAAIMPLATAFNKVGATNAVADGLVDLLGSLGPLAMLAVIFIVTTTTGLFISNSATAVLIAPIAIDAALTVGASPHAFAMTVAIACSAAYATPVSSPVNTLVLDPGGYTFVDFIKVGLPLQLLTLVVTVTLAWWLFPF